VPTNSGRNQIMKSDGSCETEITSKPDATSAKALAGLRIPIYPPVHSNAKPPTDSDLKPPGVPI